MKNDPFKEYLIQSEPNKQDKGYAWQTAIGLQAVDSLQISNYLLDLVIKNIEGDITIHEVQDFLYSYYEKNSKNDHNDRTEEADKVTIHIVQTLSEKAFSFTPNEYISIHKKLFSGIYDHAGKMRTYNITKKEWILDGDTVIYASASNLKATLEYDFSQERDFNYSGLTMDEIIHHLAVFISRLWQIHIFREGNTRTTAVFLIKYLRTLGFDVTNDIFANNAWYFRNSLVRANYTNVIKNVHETTEYLELFLRNLLLNEQNELHNRSMHISGILSSTTHFHQSAIKPNSEEIMIMKEMIKNPLITQKELAIIIEKSPRTVKSRTVKMQENGWIHRENGKRNGKWIVTIELE